MSRLRTLAGGAQIEALRLAYDSEGTQCSHEVHSMTLDALLDESVATSGRTDVAWYLQWRDLPIPPTADAWPDAPADASPAALLMGAVRLPDAIAPAAVKQVNAWIGRSRTSHLHFDGLDNLLVVVDGSKEVLLFSPWQIADCYPQLAKEERWKSAARSTLYLREGDEFDRLRKAPRKRAVLGAGDALWMPAGWWHEVLTPQVTIAFNTWWSPHPKACARLRPTMLHLHSDLYARRYAERVAEPEEEGGEECEVRSKRRRPNWNS